MPKRGFTLQVKPFLRKDPVTGEEKMFLRNAHSNQTSPRLQARKRCMRQGLQGTTVRGGDARTNALGMRQKFAQVSKACAGGR
jgi:hypothetical protein